MCKSPTLAAEWGTRLIFPSGITGDVGRSAGLRFSLPTVKKDVIKVSWKRIALLKVWESGVKESNSRVCLPEFPETQHTPPPPPCGRRTLYPSCHFVPPHNSLSLGTSNSCEGRDRGDIDGLPEQFDCRLWSLQPGLRLSLCTVVESQYRWTWQQFSPPEICCSLRTLQRGFSCQLRLYLPCRFMFLTVGTAGKLEGGFSVCWIISQNVEKSKCCVWEIKTAFRNG